MQYIPAIFLISIFLSNSYLLFHPLSHPLSFFSSYGKKIILVAICCFDHPCLHSCLLFSSTSQLAVNPQPSIDSKYNNILYYYQLLYPIWFAISFGRYFIFNMWFSFFFSLSRFSFSRELPLLFFKKKERTKIEKFRPRKSICTNVGWINNCYFISLSNIWRLATCLLRISFCSVILWFIMERQLFWLARCLITSVNCRGLVISSSARVEEEEEIEADVSMDF